MIENGNVVRHDDVIFFLTTTQFARLVHKLVHKFIFNFLIAQLLLINISRARSPGSVNYCPECVAVLRKLAF